MCSVSKLFWALHAVPNPSKCNDEIELLELLDVSTKRTILNRITPFSIDLACISSLNICKFHKYWFTDNHPTLKQTKCSILDCKNTAKYAKSVRVSLAVSQHIFNTRSEHVPVGSGII